MSADFVDPDLLKASSVARSARSGGEAGAVPRVSPPDTGRPRFQRQKEELAQHVTGTTTEIEQLRQRQEALEREKRELEALARKQQEYERSKADVMEKLDRSIVVLQREEEQAVRLVELLSETIERFKTSLEELRNIHEDAWMDDQFQSELDRAAVRVDIATTTFRKAMARIDAMGVRSGDVAPVRGIVEQVGVAAGLRWRFRDWFKIGLAVSLPVVLALLTIFVLYLFLTGIVM
ncbi:MAG: hypothetical protein A2498_12325 [Lentisphaerae bacterium RIFOXYC12_FULL_60_16]|nr:MAG: hypothetical protein A2498_12325 [Lentisphaerae bacterium RIFOXYC12_FULL_60_16]OGV75228.1 MAG: hypothetical protein A2340_05930 [Lentisphaerae bacterium RIFOXYB12_FULL_60_10]